MDAYTIMKDADPRNRQGQSPHLRFGALSAAVLAAALASTLGTTAFAQDTESTVLEEVLVTAQRREEHLQTVPASVSVMDADDLEASRVQFSSDLIPYMPNLSIQSSLKQGYTTYFMRGIGAADDTISSNPSIGFLVDGIFANSAGGNVLSVLDVERVEVVRGPQGTMFGRNTIGGVINIITRKPQDEFSAKVSAGYGNYNRLDVGASATGPLVPGVLSANLGLAHSEHDGYVENLFPGGPDAEASEDIVARGSLRLTPTDAFEALVSADYGDSEGTHYGSQPIGTSISGYTEPDNDIRKGSYDAPHAVETENWGVSAVLTWQLQAGELKWLSGHRTSAIDTFEVDYGSTPHDLYFQGGPQEERSFSSEVQFAFDVGDRTSWIVGAYYLDYEGDFDNFFAAYGFLRPFLPPGSVPVVRVLLDSTTQSWSTFANVDIELTDRLALALGGRYSDTEKDLTMFQQGEFGPNEYRGAFSAGEVPDTIAVVPFSPVLRPDGSWSRFSPRMALTFQQSDSLMLFGSLAQGHRDGGFSVGVTTEEAARPYGMEILTAYELGLKSTLRGGSARFHLTGFFYDYEDIQVQEGEFQDDGSVVTRVENVGAAESYGLEAELLMNVTPQFRISANLGLLRSEFTDGTITNNPEKGNRFSRAPEVTWSLTPEYTLCPFDAGDVVVRGEWQYRDAEYHGFDNVPDLQSESRHVLNASVSFNSRNDRWRVSVWARNLLDEEYVATSQDLASLTGQIGYSYGDPRTAGVSFAYNLR